VGLGLLTHHDDVAVTDRGVDHRVTAHPQAEDATVPGEPAGQREHVVDVLFGRDGSACRDVANDRHGHGILGRLSGRAGLEKDPHVDRPGHLETTPQEALLLQAGQMFRHRR
jgi:hypothetical protein